MKTIGILGGGQLGLMLAEAVHALGARARIFEPDASAPAACRLADVVSAPYEDTAALQAFLDEVDVATYEFENVPAEALARAKTPTPFFPSLGVLEVAQDRAREKAFFVDQDIPCVEHVVVSDVAELYKHAEAFGFPSILKTTRGGYDGKGQARIGSAADLGGPNVPRPGALGGGWIFEAPIAIERELSCIVARDTNGAEVTFPIFENEHRDHVLDVTVVPARIDDELAQAIRELSLRAARGLGVVGLLTVEFFVGPADGRGGLLVGDKRLYANELAPRPHNSGHVTRKACTLSQFDALARILVGAPVHEPALVAEAAFCMGNLLGDVWLAQGREDLDLSAWQQFPQVVEVFSYGKGDARPKRKMGHFIVREAEAQQAITTAHRFRDALRRA